MQLTTFMLSAPYCRNKLMMAKSHQIWARGSDVEVKIPLLQRSFSYYILLLTKKDHTGTLSVATRWRSCSIWNFEVHSQLALLKSKKELKETFFFFLSKKQFRSLFHELEMKGERCWNSVCIIYFSALWKTSNNHQLISFGLNSKWHFSIFFSAC